METEGKGSHRTKKRASEKMWKKKIGSFRKAEVVFVGP